MWVFNDQKRMKRDNVENSNWLSDFQIMEYTKRKELSGRTIVAIR